mmetsp:Transcript_32605/g.75882  ORF Transcript_32605/g.75882 Transcript_32605/m.75882 type:complete len:683 (-) Transcript_32605:110-2158(-)
MVRCMRKGTGALECPVCLQLFNRPVTPVGSDCKCTFCEVCFSNLVKFGGRCTKCARGLPHDASQYVINEEIRQAIAQFQQTGGEDAEYATMMTGLKGSPGMSRAYQNLEMSEFNLDPKPLASGAYGQVFKGTWLKQNIAVAVKKVLRTSVMTHEQTLESFRKEIDILAMLDHPHVLKLYAAVVDDDNICIVTELVPGGSLFDLIHTKPLLKPEAVIVIGTGVCKGMTYLHSMGIIHRDLKPGNLLMGAVQSPSGPQLVVKVADFGLARVQDTARTMTGGIGTSQYTAPEVLRSERYDTKADVFSFGVILWEMHARRIPYSEMNQMQIAVAVATKNHRPPPPKHCPSPFWQLMQHCWQTKPPTRPSFAEVLSQLEDMQFVFNLAASAHGSARPAPPVDPRKLAEQQAAARAHQAEQAQQQEQLLEQQRRMEQLKLHREASPPAAAAFSPMAVNSPQPEGSPSARPVLRVPAQFPTISDALRAAPADCKIMVSAGHYRETIVLKDAVVEILGDGNMQHILLESAEGEAALSQQGGHVRVSNMMIRGSGARTLEVVSGRMVLEDCNVSGGVCGLAATAAADVSIRRSVLCRCQQYGLHVTDRSKAVVESCSIFENGMHGVVAQNAGSSVRMTRSMVSHNFRAGIMVDDGATGTVENNDLRSNQEGPVVVGAASEGLVQIVSNLST